MKNVGAYQHPRGLPFLFATEAFERFCYYGMRAILVLYMVTYLFANKGDLADITEKAGIVYGWFTGLVYLTPLLGGYLADRFLGKRNSVVIGAVLMGLGYLLMAVPNEVSFYLALSLAILGNGFFKPNITPMVSELYDEKDVEGKNSGMTIFYMGINLGAFFSPLVCGTLAVAFGWHWGFITAGLGMVAAIIVFLMGQKAYGEVGLKKKQSAEMIKVNNTPLTIDEKQGVIAIFILAFFVMFFWMAFEQAGSSLTLFAELSTNRNFFGWEIPAAWFMSINPLFIILLGIPMTKLWVWLANRGNNPSTPTKMAIGLLLASLGFIIMIPAAALVTGGAKVSMFWLVGVYFIHTVGELCLSPVGLSMVTRLSPKKMVSLMVGAWFAATAASNYLAGKLASLYYQMELTDFFWIPAITAGLAGLILLIVKNPIKNLMKGRD